MATRIVGYYAHICNLIYIKLTNMWFDLCPAKYINKALYTQNKSKKDCLGRVQKLSEPNVHAVIA